LRNPHRNIYGATAFGMHASEQHRCMMPFSSTIETAKAPEQKEVI